MNDAWALSLTPEERTLLECALPPERFSPERFAETVAAVGDWERVLKHALKIKFGPLLYARLVETGFIAKPPRPVLMRLAASQAAAEAGNLRLLTERDRLFGTFEEEGIEALALKGCALAGPLYGDVSLRPMGDLDLLIPADGLQQAASCLMKLGYQTDGIEARGEIFFYRPEERLFIDVHLQLDASGRFRIPLEELRKASGPLPEAENSGVPRKESRTSSSFQSLSVQHHLIHALLHAARHRLESFMPLVDAAWLAARWPDAICWETIPSLARRWRCREALGFALTAAHQLFQLPVPEDTLHELAPRGWRKQALAAIWPGDSPFHPIEDRPKAIRYTFSALTTSWPGGYWGTLRRYRKRQAVPPSLVPLDPVNVNGDP